MWFPLKRHKQISGLFQYFSAPENQTYCFTINDLLTSFNKKTRSGKCYVKHFCWFIIIINAGKLNCKNYSITDLVFHEHTSQISQIQDFFQHLCPFKDFSGPKKSKLKFQDFSEPMGNLYTGFYFLNISENSPIPFYCICIQTGQNLHVTRKKQTSVEHASKMQVWFLNIIHHWSN